MSVPTHGEVYMQPNEIYASLLDRINIPDTGDDPCWIWFGATNGRYAKAYYKGRLLMVHRLVYELANGPIEDGKVIRHTCDNALCVKLSHLRIGTQRDNVQDMIDRGRAVFGTPQFGASNGMYRYKTQPKNVRRI